jgi:hypothetical protein
MKNHPFYNFYLLKVRTGALLLLLPEEDELLSDGVKDLTGAWLSVRL